MTDEHPFARLNPDFIIDAVESSGLFSDARILELNSYENRVYQIGIEDADPVIAKFYRPDRWNIDQISEEHSFTQELYDHGLSVVAPLQINCSTWFRYKDFIVALFPRKGGRAPPIDDLNCLEVLGRFIGRMHNVGAAQPFQHRPNISTIEYGEQSRTFLLENKFIPLELEAAYESVTEHLIAMVNDRFSQTQVTSLRLHADCHMGNVLWRDEQPHFVDFDDARSGPAIQDLWMLLSGDETSRQQQMQSILKGYRDFRSFNPAELSLIEPLRTLRMMHHAAWLARRWDDPAFPRAFPFFNSQKFWSDHILELREQWAAIEAPSIALID
ncbi:MAG TPA: serine/threonine protein kinase [Gammaproteobacteria bacterium]|nr:serine/threonine protein kinase [Gammaproteobacteria bacterium]|tara:strand:+ start:810 stop:1793 length:984 start_codon:yes stop_codon:yes gene_type:complete